MSWVVGGHKPCWWRELVLVASLAGEFDGSFLGLFRCKA